jgi:hypothetical protein
VNSAMIYCKNFGKCHNVPQYNNNKKKKRKLFLSHKKANANIATIFIYIIC